MDPFAILSGILDALKTLKGATSSVAANQQQADVLAQRIGAIQPHVLFLQQQLRQPAPGPDGVRAALRDQLDSLLQVLVDIFAGVNKLKAKSDCKQVWSSKAYAEKFQAFNARLGQAHTDLSVGLQVWSCVVAQQNAEDAREQTSAQLRILHEAVEKCKADLEAIRSMPPILMAMLTEAAQRDVGSDEQSKLMLQQIQAMWADLAAISQDRREERVSAQQRRQSLADRQKRQEDTLEAIQQRLEALMQRVEQQGQQAASAAQAASSSSPASSLSMAPQRIGTNQLQWGERVANGSFGDVYRALWMGKPVAVKKLRVGQATADDIVKFSSEAAIQHALRCPRVVLLYGVAVDEAAGTYQMVMEWMEGGSVYQMLADRRAEPAAPPLSLSERLRLCVECAMSILYLHQLEPPVIHRDIKSGNFLIDEHGAIKVCDFGLARMRSASAPHSTAAHAAGTTSWMPPEILLGGTHAATSDVYSLGVVCWELLTGEMPYAGQPAGQVVLAIASGKLLPTEGLPSGVAQLLRACWAMDPTKRPSCSDVIEALQQLQSDMSLVVALPATPISASVPPPTVSPASSSSVSASSAVGSSASSTSASVHWSPSHGSAGSPGVSSSPSASASQAALSPFSASSAAVPALLVSAVTHPSLVDVSHAQSMDDFSQPAGLCIDGGRLFVADASLVRERRLSPPPPLASIPAASPTVSSRPQSMSISAGSLHPSRAVDEAISFTQHNLPSSDAQGSSNDNSSFGSESSGTLSRSSTASVEMLQLGGGVVPADGISSLQLKLASTTPAPGAISVQSCARLQLRVWITLVGDVLEVVVGYRGTIQPAALPHSEYPLHHGKRRPVALVLLKKRTQQLMLVADAAQGFLFFRCDIDEAAGTVTWTRVRLTQSRPSEKLRGVSSLAFHSTSSSVIVVAKNKLYSMGLRCEAGQDAVLEAPQLMELQPRLHKYSHSSIAVDNQRDLLAVTHPADKQVCVYSLSVNERQLTASAMSLLSLSFDTARSLRGVCFDPAGEHCTLAVCRGSSVELFVLRLEPGDQLTRRSVHRLADLGRPTGVHIDGGELTVADSNGGNICVFSSSASAAATPTAAPMPPSEASVSSNLIGSLESSTLVEQSTSASSAASSSSTSVSSSFNSGCGDASSALMDVSLSLPPAAVPGTAQVQLSTPAQQRSQRYGFLVEIVDGRLTYKYPGREAKVADLGASFSATGAHSLILLDHVQLVLMSSHSGVHLLRFEADAKAGTVTWHLCAFRARYGALRLAYCHHTSTVLVTAKRFTSWPLCRIKYRCIYALRLQLNPTPTLERVGRVRGAKWLDRECHIAVNSNFKRMAIVRRQERHVDEYEIVPAADGDTSAPPIVLRKVAGYDLPCCDPVHARFDEGGALLITDADGWQVHRRDAILAPAST